MAESAQYVATGARRLYLVLAACVAACDGSAGAPGHDQAATYDTAIVSIDPGEGHVSVTLYGPSRAPCAPALTHFTVAANDVIAPPLNPGGQDRDPDIVHATCSPAEFDAASVPLNRGTLSLAFRGAPEPWAIEAAWPPRVAAWTVGDLDAAMREQGEFTLKWVPDTAPMPDLTLYEGQTEVEDGRSSLVILNTEPGAARVAFRGAPLQDSWEIVAVLDYEAVPTTCEGFDLCRIVGTVYTGLREQTGAPSTP